MSEDFVPETLTWCRHHYVPPVERFISCKEFGNIDGMDGGCWWCMEMTPYQWHMCSDETHVRGLLSPVARFDPSTGENQFIDIDCILKDTVQLKHFKPDENGWM